MVNNNLLILEYDLIKGQQRDKSITSQNGIQLH